MDPTWNYGAVVAGTAPAPLIGGVVVEPFGADTEVRVGSMLFTMVDPSRGHEVAYNRWYERDHFYGGCLIGPWLFAGRRWVATRELRDLRFPTDAPADSAVAEPVDAGSYLATYFVHKGHEAEHFAWANRQVFELYANDRGFDERHHAHTVLYFTTGDDHRDADGVPAHMALDHPYAGLVSVHVDRADDVSHPDLTAWFAESAASELFSPGPDGSPSPVDQVLHWRPIIPKGSEGDAPMDLGSGPGTKARSMHLLFLQADPREAWDRIRAYADAVDASGLATVRLVAPWIPTIPGTDTYTDQLW